MEEDGFSKNPAWNDGLIDLIAPFLQCVCTKLLLELHVNAARASTLWRPARPRSPRRESDHSPICA